MRDHEGVSLCEADWKPAQLPSGREVHQQTAFVLGGDKDRLSVCTESAQERTWGKGPSPKVLPIPLRPHCNRLFVPERGDGLPVTEKHDFPDRALVSRKPL